MTKEFKIRQDILNHQSRRPIVKIRHGPWVEACSRVWNKDVGDNQVELLVDYATLNEIWEVIANKLNPQINFLSIIEETINEN